MYSIVDYGSMIADTVRVSAYERALRKAVRPDSVVVDLGTGTGIFALLACSLGARRVYAIEPDDAIHVGRELAAANGFTDRIEFLQNISEHVALPEPADVIVSDLHGALPLSGRYIPAIVDARKRFLAPGGTLVPQQERLWAALVEVPEAYQALTSPWRSDHYGLDMRAGRRRVTNVMTKVKISGKHLLTQAACWAELDHLTMSNPNRNALLRWNAERAGTAHGIALWFESVLAEGVVISSAPDAAPLAYGIAFLPLSEEVALSEGDEVELRLSADLMGDDYVWRWHTRVTDCRHAKGVKAEFRQSSAFAAPLPLARLRKRSSEHVPRMREDGKLNLFVLPLFDGENTLQQIAAQTLAAFPGRFRTFQQALTCVADLSEQFG
jgi:protein arginine N-methyltransferase 1